MAKRRRRKAAGGVEEALPWVALLGGVGAAAYFLVIKPMTKGVEDKVAAKILSDPSKAAMVPGATYDEKYGWLVKTGVNLLEQIGVLPKAEEKVVVASTKDQKVGGAVVDALTKAGITSEMRLEAGEWKIYVKSADVARAQTIATTALAAGGALPGGVTAEMFKLT